MPVFETDPRIDKTASLSISATASLIDGAEKSRTRQDIGNRKRFARLFKDPSALGVTITLTDEVMRIHSTNEAVAIFARAARKASIKGFGVFNGLGLKAGYLGSKVAPKMVLKVVHWRVKSLSKGLILPYEERPLSGYLSKRTRDGIRLNINVLGEAVLGQSEADARLRQILEMIARPDVNYVSVKLSAVVAQMITIDHQGSLNKVCDRLRVLYRSAKEHRTFINLDMEEYRDLALTVDAFMTVLSEKEFLTVNAGIVLQAYLPESHSSFYDLVTWAQNRFAKSGGRIKIRLVKGANLAMERAEAQLNGWTPAPYQTKADVDASYSRLLDAALRPENAKAVRIGIASHNLFHLSWALEIAKTRGVTEQIDLEMLEGMANSEAIALVKSGHPVLLYAPVAKKDDFASAVAYLVRRLDENTATENYLRATFEIGSDPAKFAEQRKRFEDSVVERHTISTESRRHLPSWEDDETFFNEPSGDPTNPLYVKSITHELARVISTNGLHIPIVIDGKEIRHDEKEMGTDPSANGAFWYDYSVISRADVDSALLTCQKSSWMSTDANYRRDILKKVAAHMSGQRAQSIAIMTRDAGKTVSEADAEISEAIDFARFYATEIDDEKSTSLGPVLVVPPWNFPYAIPAGGVFAALAAGNSVILKPAPETVATAWELVQQMWAGGIPHHALQFLPSRDDEVGKYLVTHPKIKAVVLTGAFATADLFTSWRSDLNLLAETSGKNAILISACADIDSAVKDLVQSAFGHAGQKCSAASLGIVLESIYRDPLFIKQLVDDVSSLSVGAGYDLATVVGPIIGKPEGSLLRALTTLDEGESWLVEPLQLDEAGLMWRPGVKVGVKPGSWSHLHEWFGPVLGLMVAPDFETAVNWQNATNFGLTAGLHSLEPNELGYWMENVEAGNLYINRGITGAIVNRQPFGGWKQSSVGATAKAGGKHYVDSLRNWSPIEDLDLAKRSAMQWWERIGSKAIDYSGLDIEKNYHRYRRPLTAIHVRVSTETSPEEIGFIKFVADTLGIKIELSNSEQEPLHQFVDRLSGKVRWLSHEPAPASELLTNGVSLDRRPIAQRGDIEFPRWLLEQSVSITYHRYGNINGGPKTPCRGLSQRT